MGIRKDSKKIINYYLAAAIDRGELSDRFLIQYDELAKALDLQNEKYCRICCTYLRDMGYINIYTNEDGRYLSLRSTAIDFLEASSD